MVELDTLGPISARRTELSDCDQFQQSADRFFVSDEVRSPMFNAR